MDSPIAGGASWGFLGMPSTLFGCGGLAFWIPDSGTRTA